MECPHFPACGGCARLDNDAPDYASAKRGLIVDALTRAGFPAPEIGALVPTPPRSRRRIDLEAARTGNAVQLGLSAKRSHDVIDMRHCAILRPELEALLDPLRALLATLPALRRRGRAQLNLLDTGPDLLLQTEAPLDAAARARLARFAETHAVARIAWTGGERSEPETVAQLGPATIAFAGHAVTPPPGAFLQPSREAEAAITGAVLAALPPKPTRNGVVELYAGIGTLTFPLAARGKVRAYEGNPLATRALARAAGGTRIAATQRDLARQPLSPAELRADAVVLDPPFAGAGPQIAALAKAETARIVVVSCNPAALARDAGTLRQAGWQLLGATPIDAFLGASHVECVATFARA